MYLILGDPQEPFCAGVHNLLQERDCTARIVGNPMEFPWRFSWRLDTRESSSWLAYEEESPVSDGHIAGVFVRNAGWVDPRGWQPDDLTYMQVETQAALLAWLWSLSCPVVNRYPSTLWYHRRVPLLFWQRLMRQCGLPFPVTMVTNVEAETREFARQLAPDGMTGVVYGPLTSDARYLVADDTDWSGLAALQGVAPVCLTVPHESARVVCVVGEGVVWDGEPSSELTSLEPALRRFAAAAGLIFVELALATAGDGVSVVAVEPFPCAEHFAEASRRRIVDGLVNILVTEREDSHLDDLATPGRLL